MKQLVSFVAAIDRRVQKTFDACAFFLMRRLGVGKGFLRYGLNGIFAADHATLCFIPEEYGSSGAFAHALLTVWVFVLMHIVLAADTRAERVGLWSSVDLEWAKWFSAIKVVFSALLILDVAALIEHHDEPQVVGISFTMLRSLIFILHAYLHRTPPIPPPEEKKLAVPEGERALVPVPIRRS